MCTFPWALRQSAGYKRAFCMLIVEAFVASLTTELRHRAKRQLGLASEGHMLRMHALRTGEGARQQAALV